MYISQLQNAIVIFTRKFFLYISGFNIDLNINFFNAFQNIANSPMTGFFSRESIKTNIFIHLQFEIALEKDAQIVWKLDVHLFAIITVELRVLLFVILVQYRIIDYAFSHMWSIARETWEIAAALFFSFFFDDKA